MSGTARQIQVELGSRSYPIRVGENASPEFLFPFLRAKKVLLVADTHTAELYGERYLEALKQAPAEVTLSVFEAGEQSKNLGTIEKICPLCA